MESVVVFSVGAEVFHAMRFVDDLFFVGDGSLLLGDVWRQCDGTIAVLKIVFFFVGGHDNGQELLTISLQRPCSPL